MEREEGEKDRKEIRKLKEELFVVDEKTQNIILPTQKRTRVKKIIFGLNVKRGEKKGEKREKDAGIILLNYSHEKETKRGKMEAEFICLSVTLEEEGNTIPLWRKEGKFYSLDKVGRFLFWFF